MSQNNLGGHAFDLQSIGPERRAQIMNDALQVRKKLHPSPANRKANLSGERKRLIENTADRIKDIMVIEGINQKQLAERLGLSAGQVSQLLRGTRNMQLATLCDLGEALGYRFTIIPHPINED